ncbi:MAG: hypothetical protein ACK58T_06245, partial [Phycisphaerae bacterium]
MSKSCGTPERVLPDRVDALAAPLQSRDETQSLDGCDQGPWMRNPSTVDPRYLERSALFVNDVSVVGAREPTN